MKRIHRNVQTCTIAGIGLFALLFNTSCQAQNNETPIQTVVSESTQKKIQIALLLDTSSSMDGLIDQAKSQLWSLVNELSTAQCDGVKPQLQIALYQYGNQGLSMESGYIQQMSKFTGELDEISAKLFALSTNGGDEYCGMVIQKALTDLDWSNQKDDLKFIFIAGNEAFTQGRVNYVSSCLHAKEKDIVVNTIFCGDFSEGINTDWKTGSDIAAGNYMSINQNQKTVYIATPYDDKLDSLNTQLNHTYLHYGSDGVKKQQVQLSQDTNAGNLSKENKATRTISKSSSFYSNESWDLVDKSKKEDLNKLVREIDIETLPEEMQTMTEEQKVQYVAQKSAERTKIQQEITTTNGQRQTYIASKTTTEDTNLNSVMSQAIKRKAIEKKYTFTK